MATQSHPAAAPQSRWTRVPRWLGAGLALAVTLAGWLMPEFYDWTGADQSRPAPVVGWIAAGIVVFDLLILVLLIGLHYSSQLSAANDRVRWQFQIRHLLGAMTILPLWILVGRISTFSIASWALFALAIASGIWIAVQKPMARTRIGLTVVCQYAPFLWLIKKSWNSLDGWAVLGMFPALPFFFPAALLASLFRIRFDDGQFLFFLVTSICFVIGIGLSLLGPRSSFAWSLVLATCSLFGSFIFHALMRA